MRRDLKRLGPKAWRPLGIWPESSLLSLEEKMKAAKIERQAKAWGRPPSQEDMLWLCALTRRLAAISPDNYDFQEYMALANRITNAVFAIRYVRTVSLKNTVSTENFLNSELLNAELFKTRIDCDVCQAVMVVRPYVRIHAPADPEAIEAIRTFQVTLSLEHYEVLRGPVEEHLILPAEAPPRKILFKFKVSSIDQKLYPAVRLRRREQAPYSIPIVDQTIGDGIFEADGTQCEGIFCPKDTDVSLRIHGGEFKGKVTLTAGLVAALYSTKRPEG